MESKYKLQLITATGNKRCAPPTKALKKKKKNPVAQLAQFSECCLVMQAELEKSSATAQSSHF